VGGANPWAVLEPTIEPVIEGAEHFFLPVGDEDHREVGNTIQIVEDILVLKLATSSRMTT
jgi:hypothetical protein